MKQLKLNSKEGAEKAAIAWVLPNRATTPTLPFADSGKNATEETRMRQGKKHTSSVQWMVRERRGRFLGMSRTLKLSTTALPEPIAEEKRQDEKEVVDDFSTMAVAETREQMITNKNQIEGFAAKTQDMAAVTKEQVDAEVEVDTAIENNVEECVGSACAQSTSPADCSAQQRLTTFCPTFDNFSLLLGIIPCGFVSGMRAAFFEQFEERPRTCSHCLAPFSFMDQDVEKMAYHDRCKVKAFFHLSCSLDRSQMKLLRQQLCDQIIKFGLVQQEIALERGASCPESSAQAGVSKVTRKAGLYSSLTQSTRSFSKRRQKRSDQGTYSNGAIRSIKKKHWKRAEQHNEAITAAPSTISGATSMVGSMILPSFNTRHHHRPQVDGKQSASSHRGSLEDRKLRSRAVSCFPGEQHIDLSTAAKDQHKSRIREQRQSIVDRLFGDDNIAV